MPYLIAYALAGFLVGAIVREIVSRDRLMSSEAAVAGIVAAVAWPVAALGGLAYVGVRVAGNLTGGLVTSLVDFLEVLTTKENDR